MNEFWNTLLDAFLDTLFDTLKIAPFLFLIYLFMEFIEHKAGDKTKDFISKSGKFGPLLGGVLGAVPQCGFSAACSGLYAGGVITVGTLLAVFLSTSDEMLPIMLTGGVPVLTVLKIVGVKVLFGAAVGFIVDLVARTKKDNEHKTTRTSSIRRLASPSKPDSRRGARPLRPQQIFFSCQTEMPILFRQRRSLSTCRLTGPSII